MFMIVIKYLLMNQISALNNPSEFDMPLNRSKQAYPLVK